MADFLLVHGSCHGAWCWREVIPHLTALGHSARAIDLPGHGADPTPRDQVTLDGYGRAIVAALDDRPTVVVGHSMAGYPITLAADMAEPGRIAALVYLCAYVPAPGMSLADMRRAGPRQPLAGAIDMAPDRLTFRFRDDRLAEVFYQDCPEGTVDLARAHLTPQAVLPQETPLTPGPRWAAVPRHYIRCTGDRVIPPEYQATMAEGFPAHRHSTLDASHSPFFSMPDTLARRLHDIAEAT